jgi:shikimate kinase
LDAIVSAQQNMSVPELIKEQGESSFRDAETASLQAVLDRQAPRIVALGGGAWTLERNRELINKHGCLTVWLDAPYDLCWQRITNHPAPRPLAVDENAARELYRQRRPLYALAGLRVEVTNKMSADDLATAIEQRVSAKH